MTDINPPKFNVKNTTRFEKRIRRRRPYKSPPAPKVCRIIDAQLKCVYDVFESKSAAQRILWKLCQALPPKHKVPGPNGESPDEPDRYYIEPARKAP